MKKFKVFRHEVNDPDEMVKFYLNLLNNFEIEKFEENDPIFHYGTYLYKIF